MSRYIFVEFHLVSLYMSQIVTHNMILTEQSYRYTKGLKQSFQVGSDLAAVFSECGWVEKSSPLFLPLLHRLQFVLFSLFLRPSLPIFSRVAPELHRPCVWVCVHQNAQNCTAPLVYHCSNRVRPILCSLHMLLPYAHLAIVSRIGEASETGWVCCIVILSLTLVVMTVQWYTGVGPILCLCLCLRLCLCRCGCRFCCLCLCLCLCLCICGDDRGGDILEQDRLSDFLRLRPTLH